MKIEIITIVEFDDGTEKARIEQVFAGERKKSVREWLLSIHASFVAGDWAAACTQLRNAPKYRDENTLEYVNEIVFDTLSDYQKRGRPNQTFSITGPTGSRQWI